MSFLKHNSNTLLRRIPDLIEHQAFAQASIDIDDIFFLCF